MPPTDLARIDAESQAIVTANPEHAAAALSHILATGDLSKLTNEARVAYYLDTCRSLSLNPRSRPFDWLMLDGKLVLYPNKSCAEQLRRTHQIRVRIVRSEPVGMNTDDPMFVVKVEGTTPNGRTDEATKYVPLTVWDNKAGKRVRLRGEKLANAYAKAECVPLDSEILTPAGWKRYDQLTIGEDVLAYDGDSDLCRWTPLLKVTTYPEALTVRFGTERTAFRCTLDHSWVVQHPPYRPDRRGDGSRGSRGAYANRRPERELMEAQRISSGADRVVLAAPAESGSHALTAQEAAILGWVMTDGSIRRRGTFVQLSVSQSKPAQIAEISALMDASGFRVTHTVGQPGERDFGAYVSSTLAQHRWYVSAHDSRALLAKAGIETPAHLPALVTQLSSEARAAMLGAMMAADGDARGRFGKKRKPGVMEAWEILATLEGHALGIVNDRGAVPLRRLRSQRLMAASNATLTEGAAEPVWCPTTAFGTWVMRQGDGIAITGNTGAKRRLVLSMVGLASPPDPEESTSARYVVVDGSGNILDNPSETQRALAADPGMAHLIGEPVFEDLAIADDRLPDQRVRPEELETPKREGPRPSFKNSDEQIAKWRSRWFANVKGLSLDSDDARARFFGSWTRDELSWPEGKQTDSLTTFLKRCDADSAEELLSHVRALMEDERRALMEDAAAGSGDATLERMRANEDPKVSASAVLTGAPADGDDEPAF